MGAAFLGGEVDHDGILAAVEPDKVAALALGRGIIAAGKIAFGTFDLDDMRAGVRQPRTAERGGDRLLDGDDGNSFKRQHGVGLSRSAACPARARRRTTGSNWSRSAPPGRAGFRGIFARYRILRRRQIRHRSARRHWPRPRPRLPPASWPCWPRRRIRARPRICEWLPSPSVRRRALPHRLLRSETGRLDFGRSAGRTPRAPWHT